MSLDEILEAKIAVAVEKALKKSPPPMPLEVSALLFYTPEKLASMLEVDEGTIRKWCRNGELSHTKFGKFIRITPDHLKQYCAKNTTLTK